MKISAFGEKFSSKAGITSLMEDLGSALAGNSDMIMMGGGNPAHIPAVQDCFKARMKQILANEQDFQQLVGIYDPPQGNLDFINALVAMLNAEYGWKLSPTNIALTNGSQAAFFMLFNLFGGADASGQNRQIQLPLAPEYIGYTDTGLSDNLFISNRPSIEQIDSETFKYHVDFNELKVTDTTGAICVSRPTNPTGNVLTHEEMSKLSAIAKTNDIPLIIDSAYGTPFPNLIFTEVEPIWDDNTIVCLSLSKFGLPAARTGIVIASEEVIQALSGMNAVLNLATGSFGSLMAQSLVEDRSILRLSNEVIKPYYLSKSERAKNLLCEYLQGVPFSIHKIEGAMFMWLWLKDCPLSNQEIYQQLKARGVLIVSGHHFFPGLDEDNWQHKRECLRITYSQDDQLVEKGLKILSEVVREAYTL